MKRPAIIKILTALLITAATVLSGCAFFQPTGATLTNNTGAEISVVVTKSGNITDEDVTTFTLADGGSQFIDVASFVPLFGSVSNTSTSGNYFNCAIEGNYYYGNRGFEITSAGTTAADIDLDANAAYVTLTNNAGADYATITLTATSPSDLFGVTGRTVATNFADGDSESFPVTEANDYLNGYYASTQWGLGTSLNILSTEVGTNVTRTIE